MATKTKAEEVEVIDVPATNENGAVVLSADRIDTDTIIANIDAQEIIFKKLQEYVKSNLVAKTDYYSIKKGSKPSLGKPGAEKINFIFNLVPRYVILSETNNSSEIAFKLRGDLYNKNSGKFMGSGVGYCSSKEDKIQKSMQKQGIKNVESVGNNVFKICKKRCYVDATLSSTMASFIFTQDLEDGYLGAGDNKTTYPETTTSKSKYPSNEDYWKDYDFTKVDLNVVPPTRGFDKAKNKPIPSMESLKIYFYACDIMPKKEVKGFFESITGKPKAWEYTYGDIKNILVGLEEIKKQETVEETNIQQGFEEQKNER